jgi:hypothetical protein
MYCQFNLENTAKFSIIILSYNELTSKSRILDC